ncbi:MAG: thioredoxin-like domain-containing protein [Bacteroidota bacterium]
MINKCYRISFLILIFFALSLGIYANPFIIKGKVEGRTTGIVRLGQVGSSSFETESCKLTNGEFYFKSWLSLPEEFYLTYLEKEGSRESNYFKFFLEPGSENIIRLDPQNVDRSSFTGSPTGNEYHRLQLSVREKFGSQPEGNIENEILDFKMDYIKENPGSYISANWLHTYQYNLDIDTVRKYFNHLSPMLEESKYYQKIINYLLAQRGKHFIDFQLADQEGKILQFSSFARNKIVLINFWSSECIPCREYHVKLKQLYEAYRDKGFEIMGISLDSNKSTFLQAIKADEMTWPNLMDRPGRYSILTLYENNDIPFMVLIDRNGTIAYRNNNYEKLKIEIEKLMKR